MSRSSGCREGHRRQETRSRSSGPELVPSWTLASGGASRPPACVGRGSRVRVPRAGLCGVVQPKGPQPRPVGPACSCRAAAAGGVPRALSPAPRSGPYVTDFEFPDRGTHELGRRLCPPGGPPVAAPAPHAPFQAWSRDFHLSLVSRVSPTVSSSFLLSSPGFPVSFISRLCVAQSLPVPVLCFSPRVFSPSPTLSGRPHLFGVGREFFPPANWRWGLVQTDPSPSLPRKRGGEDYPGRVGGGYSKACSFPWGGNGRM